MHNLSINILDQVSCDKLTVQDTSSYDELIPVTNTILEIKPPTQSTFKTFNLDEDWCSTTITCSDLCVCCGACFSLLPDGNYEIKFSVNPNLTTMVEYNYFRICQIWKRYVHSFCSLRELKYNMTISEYDKKLENLYKIRNMILDAKILAEECLKVSEAYELYNEASALLNNKDECPTC